MVWDFEQQNVWMVWDFQLLRQVHMTFRACRARAAVCWIIYWVKCTQCLLNCYPMQSGSRSWYSLLGFIKCDCLLAKRLIKALPWEAIWMLLPKCPLAGQQHFTWNLHKQSTYIAADCIDLANSKQKMLCTCWVSNKLWSMVYHKATLAVHACVLTAT